MKTQHYDWDIVAQDASPKSNNVGTLDKLKLREGLHCNWPIRNVVMEIKRRLKNVLDQWKLMEGDNCIHYLKVSGLDIFVIKDIYWEKWQSFKRTLVKLSED